MWTTYHSVVIYTKTDKIKLKKPCFNLEIIERKANKFRIGKYKITFSKLKSQMAYDDFKSKVFNAIIKYNAGLEDWASTIFFWAFVTYRDLVDINFAQQDALNSAISLQSAKPLASIFSILAKHKEQNTIQKELTFHIGGQEFKFRDASFINWLMDIIRKAITNGNYPLDLGYNMLELEEALKEGSKDGLQSLATRESNGFFIENSQLLSSWCLAIHRQICRVLGKDADKITTKQLELYSSLLGEFEVPHSESYLLLYKSDKKVKDRFRLLLKRANCDISAFK